MERGGVPGPLGAWRDIPRLRTEPPGTTAYMRLRAAGGPAAAEEWTNVAELSPYALCAIVGAEDPAFFEHHGIWWRHVARRTVVAVRTGRPPGGVSTITQQLARNLYLHERRSVRRKLLEMLLAVRLERVLDKGRILELYVNVVEWGAGTWGIENAARAYFGSTAAALNPFQAVVLASLLPAPRAPLAGRNLARASASQHGMLHFLYGAGVMTLLEWWETRERLALLAAALRDGRAQGPVLRELGDRSYPGAADHVPPPTAAQLLESRCGLRLRRAYTAVLRAQIHRSAPPPRLPERWTDGVAG